MIHVIKHDMDPNSNINYRRKIGPKSIYFILYLHFHKTFKKYLQHSTTQLCCKNISQAKKDYYISHFFYYDKSGKGKKCPFAFETSLPNSIKTNLQTCNLQTGHLDRVNSIKVELQDLQLTKWPVQKLQVRSFD